MADATGASTAGVSPASAPVPETTASDKGEQGAGDAGGDAATAAARKEPAPSFKGTKHRVKVDGTEAEVEYDELVRDYQLRKVSDKRLKEAAELAKRVKAEFDQVESFRKDPWAALKQAGQDPYALAEQLLLQKMEWEGLSEAERRAQLAELKAQSLEERIGAEEKRAKEARSAQAEAQALREIDDEIGDALKSSGKKPTPRMIARITETLIAHHERQLEGLRQQFGDEIPEEAYSRVQRLPASEAVKRVHREYLGDVAEFLSGMSAAELKQALPREILDALRQAEVDAVLSQDPVGSRKARTEPAPRSSQRASKRMSTDDYFAKLEEKITKRA
jgi:hypothetical protein